VEMSIEDEVENLGKSKFDTEEKKEKTTEEQVDKLLEESEKLDLMNPSERAVKYNMLKKNLPPAGYNEIKLYQVKEEGGKQILISVSKKADGDYKFIEHEPISSIDLNKLLTEDINSCPSSVMPMLIDESVQVALQEKKEFKPEKAHREFNWWWIVFFMLPIPALVLWLLGVF
jgi:hypothetical protein